MDRQRLRFRVVAAFVAAAGLPTSICSAGIAPEVEREIERLSSYKTETRAWAIYNLGEMGANAAPAVSHLIPFLDFGRFCDLPSLIMTKTDDGTSLRLVTVYSGKNEWPFEFQIQDSTLDHLAEEALAKIGKPAVPELIAGLTAENSSRRFSCARLLGKIGDQRAFPTLVEALRDDHDVVRHRVVSSLIELDKPRARNVFVAALGGKNPSVLRHTAARALQDVPDPISIDALAEALKDESRNVRMESARALARIDHSRVVEPLVRALNDEDWYVRRWTAAALGRVRQPAIADALLERLGADNEHILVRANAGLALGTLGDLRAVEPLIHFMNEVDHSGWFTRGDAARALGRIAQIHCAADGTTATALKLQIGAALIAVLDDAEGSVVWKTTQAMIPLKEVRAIPRFIENLEHEHHNVREYTVLALGEIGDGRAVEPLAARLEDEYWVVRKNAAEALGKIGDERAVEPLRRRLATEPVEACRTAIIDALHAITGGHPELGRIGSSVYP